MTTSRAFYCLKLKILARHICSFSANMVFRVHRSQPTISQVPIGGMPTAKNLEKKVFSLHLCIGRTSNLTLFCLKISASYTWGKTVCKIYGLSVLLVISVFIKTQIYFFELSITKQFGISSTWGVVLHLVSGLRIVLETNKL